MTVSASSRVSLRRHWVAVVTGASLATGIGGICSASSTDEATVGAWQAHQYQFQYLSDNTTYSCIGLADKLRLLLGTVEARRVHVNPVCLGSSGVPDRFAQADMRFESLIPEGQLRRLARRRRRPGSGSMCSGRSKNPGPSDPETAR